MDATTTTNGGFIRGWVLARAAEKCFGLATGAARLYRHRTTGVETVSTYTERSKSQSSDAQLVTVPKRIAPLLDFVGGLTRLPKAKTPLVGSVSGLVGPPPFSLNPETVRKPVLIFFFTFGVPPPLSFKCNFAVVYELLLLHTVRVVVFGPSRTALNAAADGEGPVAGVLQLNSTSAHLATFGFVN
jgi:hypothetical protein